MYCWARRCTIVLSPGRFFGSSLMQDVGLVVLDEVHYLGDPGRGSVWEEVRRAAWRRVYQHADSGLPSACGMPAADLG